MGQVLHGGARTTEAVRRAIQNSQESLRALSKVKHPWTNGQVERMNRTIKDATVRCFHYDDHAKFEAHLAEFIAADNFDRRLKTLCGLTPYEDICTVWTSQPERFRLHPIHQNPH